MKRSTAQAIAARRQLLRTAGNPYTRAAYAKAIKRRPDAFWGEIGFLGIVFITVVVLVVAA